MHSKILLFSVLLAGALAGCQSTRHSMSMPQEMNVTPGSLFTVVKPFLIPSGDSSVFFQDAGLYPQGEIHSDYPYCEFILGAATADGELIKGIYTVSNVAYDQNGISAGASDLSVTTIHLQESSSGKRYRMNCMLPMPSRGADFVTPAEIQGAVGGHMELKVAP